MDGGSGLMYLLLLCVVSSLDTSPLIGVNGQSVHLYKSIPEGNPVEGETVQLRCDANNLVPGNVIEWSRTIANQDVIIARNAMSKIQGYAVAIQSSSFAYRGEILTIYNNQRNYTGHYVCRLKNSDGDNSTTLVIDGYDLTVNYFPSDMYPVCFPNGSFTVQEGTTLNMSCITERGEPQVHAQIVSNGEIYPWMESTINDEETASLQLQVSAVNNDNSYTCQISSTSFPGMGRSCTIGPITVVPMTTPSYMATSKVSTHPYTRTTSDIMIPTTVSQQPTDAGMTSATDGTQRDATSTSPVTDQSCCHLCQSAALSSPVPWIATSVSFIVLFIISVTINIFFITNRHRNRKSPNDTNKETNETKADPYMELQPTDDRNRQYMEPTAIETVNEQHTYYQTVGEDSGRSGDDYERPVRKSSTTYEEVGVI